MAVGPVPELQVQQRLLRHEMQRLHDVPYVPWDGLHDPNDCQEVLNDGQRDDRRVHVQLDDVQQMRDDDDQQQRLQPLYSEYSEGRRSEL